MPDAFGTLLQWIIGFYQQGVTAETSAFGRYFRHTQGETNPVRLFDPAQMDWIALGKRRSVHPLGTMVRARPRWGTTSEGVIFTPSDLANVNGVQPPIGMGYNS